MGKLIRRDGGQLKHQLVILFGLQRCQGERAHVMAYKYSLFLKDICHLY